jgi:SSS family solute:Na+ symporter
MAEAAAFIAAQFKDLMEFLQMVVSLFYAPLFAVVLSALLRRRPSERRACMAVFAGVGVSAALQAGARLGLVPFGSQMAANFYIALIAFSFTALACVPVPEYRRGARARVDVSAQSTEFGSLRPSRSLVALGSLLLLACLVANLLWW